MIQARPGVLTAAFVLAAPGAFAATLTFGTELSGCRGNTASYTEAGLTIAALPTSTLAVSIEPAQEPDTGSGGCILGFADPFLPGGGDVLAWEMTTGAPFSLSSIIAAHIDAPDPVTFTGFRDGALVATRTVGSAGIIDLSDFRLVDSVVMSMVVAGPGDPRFDDLTYDAPVPLPAAGPILGAALAGLGLLRLRRRRQAPA